MDKKSILESARKVIDKTDGSILKIIAITCEYEFFHLYQDKFLCAKIKALFFSLFKVKNQVDCYSAFCIEEFINLCEKKEYKEKEYREIPIDLISNIYEILFYSLRNRFMVVEKIAIIKKNYNIPILVKSRWSEILQKKIEWAKEKNIPQEFVVQFFEYLHQTSLSFQTEINTSN